MTITCGTVHHLDPPPGVQEYLSRYGGLNLYGEPLYRIVWSMSRREWRTVRFIDYDDHGNFLRSSIERRWRRKHTRLYQRERFIIEVYVPPSESGTPKEWYERNTTYIDGQAIAPLGLYPSRGDYRFLATVERIEPASGLHKERHLFAWPTKGWVKQVVDEHRFILNAEVKDIACRLATLDRDEEEASVNFYLEQIKNAKSYLSHLPHAFVPGLKGESVAA